jgi:CheY-like chemotaxis protein
MAGETQAKAKILVVDDEAINRHLFMALLGRMNFDTVEAAGGREAVERLSAEPGAFSAAIVDLSMPGVKPAELIQGLRRIRPGLPVIVTSGHGQQEAEARLGPGIMSAFVPKPFDIPEFEQTVRRVLANP